MAFNVKIDSSKTGFNATVLPATVGTNSNAIPCDNCKEVRFDFDLVWAASTDVQYKIQVSDHDDPTAAIPAVSWRSVMSEAILAGVGTLSVYSKINTAGASRSWSDSVGCAGARFVRLADVYGTGSTTDTLTVDATLVQEQ
jgi:hypothetical protein